VILAIDPGHAGEGNACALGDARQLHGVWFERFTGGALECPAPVSVVVVEKPQQDGRSHGVRPRDLINLSWSGALLAGAYAGRDGAALVALHPSDQRDSRCALHSSRPRRGARVCTCARGWKGSEPKPLMHKRLWAVLAEAERRELGGRATERAIMAAVEKGALSRWSKPGASYYPKSFTAHNTLDACSLYAYYVGRLKRVA
jgi:hypothetical protein